MHHVLPMLQKLKERKRPRDWTHMSSLSCGNDLVNMFQEFETSFQWRIFDLASRGVLTNFSSCILDFTSKHVMYFFLR